MSNLTFDENLIREHKAEPLEGHTVVVLERVGESGEKFHSLLEPGDERPRQGLFATLLGRPALYFAFAVDATKARSLSFDEHVQMAERAHEFDLHFSLWYRVGDAQLLVATRTSDPLERVRRKVAEVIREEIAELRWMDVRESFRASSDAVVNATAAELKMFARDYGISITSLRLRADFPEREIDTDRQIYELRERGRLARERVDVGQEVRVHRSTASRETAEREEQDRAEAARREFQEVVTRETTGKFGDLIRGAGSIDDLGDVHRGISRMAGVLGLPTSSGGTAALPPVNGHHPPQQLPPGGTGFPAVLSDLVSLTQFRPEAQSRRVRASLLHVVAEAVADDSSQVSTELAACARRAHDEIDAASLPADWQQALHDLADPQQLHQRLYP
jgi:hypothetical protein